MIGNNFIDILKFWKQTKQAIQGEIVAVDVQCEPYVMFNPNTPHQRSSTGAKFIGYSWDSLTFSQKIWTIETYIDWFNEQQT